MGGTIILPLSEDKKNKNKPKAAQLTSDLACTRPHHQGGTGKHIQDACGGTTANQHPSRIYLKKENKKKQKTVL